MEGYTRIRKLGQGAFGVVLLAHEEATRMDVAIKEVAIDARNVEGQTRYLTREVINHMKLRHPHIVLFRHVFRTPTHVCIVMEYANRGPLVNLVGRQGSLSQADARWYFQQLIFALHFAHMREVANRDIKLDNLLLHLEPGHERALLKMCDFGYSWSVDDSTPRTRVGTPVYMAPEVISADPPAPGAPPPPAYDAARADVWSCGVVLYVMLFGRYPFVQEGDSKLSERKKLVVMRERMEAQEFSLDRPRPPRVHVTDECRDLLRGLLQPNPAQRLTLEQIMAHAWFNVGLPITAHAMNQDYLNAPLPQGPAREMVEQLIRQEAV